MPELQRRKKELAAKRELYAPLSNKHEEMDTHLKNYNQIKKFKEYERE